MDKHLVAEAAVQQLWSPSKAISGAAELAFFMAGAPLSGFYGHPITLSAFSWRVIFLVPN